MCRTTHAQAPNAARKAVVNEFEFLLCTAIIKCRPIVFIQNQVVYKSYVLHYGPNGGSTQWNKMAIKLHESLGLDIQQAVLWKNMEVTADHFAV